MYRPALALTKQLVKIESASGSEQVILEFVGSWLTKHGFQSVHTNSLFTTGKIAGIPNSRTALILCGHIDTVVSGNASGWKTPPTTPVVKDGKLFGLGTTDMKAGVAVQMALAEHHKNKQLPFDIWTAAVAGEETNGSGAKAFVEWFQSNTNYDTAYCLIAEPTDLARLEIGHRGSSFVELTFTGRTGHGSNPDNYQVSGLKLAQDFLNALPTITAQLEKEFAHPILGTPTIVPTCISAGDPSSPNKTSGVAQVMLDLRTTPQFDDAAEQWITTMASQHRATWRYPEPPTYAGLCDVNAKIVRAALAATGYKMPAISHGATDQVSFQRAGIDTVVYGPGEFAMAHAQNEYVELAKLERACHYYQAIIEQLQH